VSLLHFFLSPAGRICRQEYWLGLIVMFGVSIPVTLLLDPSAFDAARSEEGRQGLAAAMAKVPSVAETVWSLILTWPSAAISIKRFNDRDRPWWTGWLLMALMALLVLANGAGFMLDPDQMSPPEKVLFAVTLSYVTWSLIDNGFYRGTVGSNRHGPDPLPRPVSAHGD
jgi:uncharacterized membrane protein YhaH (DUF805 family)